MEIELTYEEACCATPPPCETHFSRQVHADIERTERHIAAEPAGLDDFKLPHSSLTNNGNFEIYSEPEPASDDAQCSFSDSIDGELVERESAVYESETIRTFDLYTAQYEVDGVLERDLEDVEASMKRYSEKLEKEDSERGDADSLPLRRYRASLEDEQSSDDKRIVLGEERSFVEERSYGSSASASKIPLAPHEPLNPPASAPARPQRRAKKVKHSENVELKDSVCVSLSEDVAELVAMQEATYRRAILIDFSNESWALRELFARDLPLVMCLEDCAHDFDVLCNEEESAWILTIIEPAELLFKSELEAIAEKKRADEIDFLCARDYRERLQIAEQQRRAWEDLRHRAHRSLRELSQNKLLEEMGVGDFSLPQVPNIEIDSGAVSIKDRGNEVSNSDENDEAALSSMPRNLCGHVKLRFPRFGDELHRAEREKSARFDILHLPSGGGGNVLCGTEAFFAVLDAVVAAERAERGRLEGAARRMVRLFDNMHREYRRICCGPMQATYALLNSETIERALIELRYFDFFEDCLCSAEDWERDDICDKEATARATIESCGRTNWLATNRADNLRRDARVREQELEDIRIKLRYAEVAKELTRERLQMEREYALQRVSNIIVAERKEFQRIADLFCLEYPNAYAHQARWAHERMLNTTTLRWTPETYNAVYSAERVKRRRCELSEETEFRQILAEETIEFLKSLRFACINEDASKAMAVYDAYKHQRAIRRSIYTT